MKNLKELLIAMKENELNGIAEVDGTDPNGNTIYDWSNLPKFGGEEPEDTDCVWSWDEKNLLVGECCLDLKIVKREDW